MSKSVETYDHLIIGGGLFGIYAGLYLHRQGSKVLVLEKDGQLMRRASLVNQARLHGGYHYPRSIATARMSDDHKQRFTSDHQDFILSSFEKYYAIDRFGSFTDSLQFERFCAYLDLPCIRVTDHPAIAFNRLEALYRTKEDTFDPVLIADYYRSQVEEAGLPVALNSTPVAAETEGEQWRIFLEKAGEKVEVRSSSVINATYASTNQVNRLFGISDIDLMHEISEIVLLSAPSISNLGLTVMDGPFGSIMPFGRSGLHSLSSVAYTHHEVSYDNRPKFHCQEQRVDCSPDQLADCKHCFAQPRSNYHKMKVQMSQYFRDTTDWQKFRSYFTVKSKLKASHIDDGRPTEITILRKNPDFYCLFAGKINSIYEIEKIL
jgi:hypothetical protein